MPRSCKVVATLIISISIISGCGTGSTTSLSSSISSAVPPPNSMTQPVKIQPNTDALNVTQSPFYAKGDGITDDTVAIQSAIATACDHGGGQLYFPKGTYVISMLHSTDKGALVVNCDDVTFIGDGMGVSVLSRKLMADNDPDLICPSDENGTVNRGAGIYVSAKTAGDNTRHSFHFRQLSLIGNRRIYTNMRGSNKWPATVSNCFNAWDISDKGLYVQQDSNSDDVVIDQAEIAYFSGELVYGGSMKSTRWAITNSNLHNSNGDAISIGAEAEIVGDILHDLGANGIENLPYGRDEPQVITDNTIFNIQLDGIGVIIYPKTFYDASPPPLELARNYIKNASRFGIAMLSRGGSIHDNQIYDSGVAFGTSCGIALIGILDGGSYQVPRNITLINNTVEAQSVDTTCGVQVYSPPAAQVPAYGINIQGNRIGPLQASTPSSKYISVGLMIAAGGNDISIKNNILW